jgi:hypothetical protein
MALVRLAVVMVALLATANCAFVQLQTTAVVVAPDAKGDLLFFDATADDTVTLTGLAMGCILTAMLYGGACWAYLAVPFEGDVAAERRALIADVKAALPCARVLDVHTEVVGWGSARRRFRITNDGAVPPADLCHAKPAPTPSSTPPTTPPSTSTSTPAAIDPAQP